MTFEPELVRRLREAEEIRIETGRSAGSPVNTVTIWVVTIGRDVYIRSVRGLRGRWYREAVGSRRAVVHLGRRRIPVKVIRVTDPTLIDRVSAAYRRKYGRNPETDSMVRQGVLRTTLRLMPEAS